jgi:hypothetical protein
MKSVAALQARGVIPTVLLLDPATFGVAPSALSTAALVRQRGVTCHIIPRGFVHAPEKQPEKKPTWTWRQTLDGHAIPVQSASYMWKKGAAK